MTGLFTYRNFSLEDTPPLDGKTAVVTGGHAGIGRDITAQLLLHKIDRVFILGRNKHKYIDALDEWRQQDEIFLGDNSNSRTVFVECDLADIPTVKRAAEWIKRRTESLHILICNAGTGVSMQYSRSEQEVDTTFAANCVGHQLLVTVLLPLIKQTIAKAPPSADTDARIVVTSSSMHMICRQLDLDLLTSPTRPKVRVVDGVWRYGRSKLGNILFAKELTRRLDEDGDPVNRRIYVNCFFPGNIVTDQWDTWNEYVGRWIGALLRAFFSLFGQSRLEGAATALYLAASREVRKKDQRGLYFIPIARPDSTTRIACDPGLARNVWDWIDAKIAESLGSYWQDDTGDGR